MPQAADVHETSVLLRRQIEELRKETIRLAAQAEKLAQESNQLSKRIKSIEISKKKPK